MAKYKCPLQEHIDALQNTANKMKAEKIREFSNKGWKVYNYKPNCFFSVVCVSNKIANDFSSLNFTADILQAIESEIEEDDYVIF